MTTTKLKTDPNNPWSSFRLPIPLQTPTGASFPSLPSYCSDEWILRLLNLMRLLHVMKNGDGGAYNIEVMESQIRLAESGLYQIESEFVPLVEHHRHDAEAMDQAQLNFQANIDALIEDLRKESHSVCNAHRKRLDLLRIESKTQKRDYIAEIFLMPEDESPLLMTSQQKMQHNGQHNGQHYDDENDLEFSDDDPSIEEEHSDSQQHRQSTPHRSHKSKAQQEELDPVQFQKQQQSLLESELSTLASRLKSSTLSLSSTLKSQTRELEEFESLAQANLDSVSSTATKVQERVKQKKGWKKRLGTWSLIFTVICVWIGCFLVMRTLPKRRVDYSQWKLPMMSSLGWILDWMPQYTTTYEEDEDQYAEDNNIDEDMYAEQERRQREYLQQQRLYHEEQKRKWNEEQERQWEQRKAERCEIMSDGSQHCPDDRQDYYSGSERKAQEMAAERKRNRIEERMANAPMVDAVDVDEATERKQKLEAKRLRVEEEARLQQEMEARAAEDQKRREEEVERHRKIEEDARLQREQEEARLQRETKARAAEEQKRREEEAERVQQAVEQARLLQEAQAQAAKEKQRLEEVEIQNNLAAQREEQIRLENEQKAEAAKIRQKKERARLLKDAAAQAAAKRVAREEQRQHLDAIKREKAEIERVRKAASDEADAALEQARDATSESVKSEILPSDMRFVASQGKNALLAHYITQKPDMVDASDGSGWRPIHEAARGGNLAGLKLLIDSGSDLSARTGRTGGGGTALWWAVQRYGENSDVVRLLRSYDAPEHGPEL